MHWRILLSLMISSVLLWGTAWSEVVLFPDPGLDAAVRDAIGKPAGEILDTDLIGTGFQKLDASSQEISDLSGIEYCTDLVELSLSGNNITDLGHLASLTGLQKLNVGSNEISDLTPLASLIGLYQLYVGDNPLTSLVPLASLTNLEILSIERTGASDLSALSGLANLMFFDAIYNQIQSLEPLENLTHLYHVILSYNQISSIAPLAECTWLTVLMLSDNEIGDISALANLPHLEMVQMDSNLISDLTPLSGHSLLKELDLTNNLVTDVSPLMGLNALTWLGIGGNPIASLEPLKQLPALAGLSLSGGGCSDISAVGELTGLASLDVSGNGLSDLTLLASLSQLTGLSASDNPLIDISTLADLPHLRGLHLRNSQIVDLTPLKHLRELRYIDLSGNPLTDIMPLVLNPNLTSGAMLLLYDILLNQEILCRQIPVLESRWVLVYCSGTCESAEDCNMFEVIRTQAQAVADEYAESWDLYASYNSWDVENWPVPSYGDGIFDLWQLRIFANAYCNDRHRLHSRAVNYYEANMAALKAEKPECANPWVAACVSLSTGMRTAVCNMFGLNPNHYQVIKHPTKALDEPFSADGDCDGDGVSNLDEYLFVTSVGGDLEDFMMEAGENNPFWGDNPQLPAAGAMGLLMAAASIIWSARKRIQ